MIYDHLCHSTHLWSSSYFMESFICLRSFVCLSNNWLTWIKCFMMFLSVRWLQWLGLNSSNSFGLHSFNSVSINSNCELILPFFFYFISWQLCLAALPINVFRCAQCRRDDRVSIERFSVSCADQTNYINEIECLVLCFFSLSLSLFRSLWIRSVVSFHLLQLFETYNKREHRASFTFTNIVNRV